MTAVIFHVVLNHYIFILIKQFNAHVLLISLQYIHSAEIIHRVSVLMFLSDKCESVLDPDWI